MEVRAIYKYARCSAFKAREVTRAIQGMPAEQALDYLMFTPRKAARLVEKTLKSAMANAENNEDMDRSELVIKEAVVGEGPTIKRFRARARGSAARIRKRTSHIRIILTDELDAWKVKDRADQDDSSRRRSRKKSQARIQQPAAVGGAEAAEELADVEADDELERMNAEAEAELAAEEQADAAAQTDAETSEPTDSAEAEPGEEPQK